MGLLDFFGRIRHKIQDKKIMKLMVKWENLGGAGSLGNWKIIYEACATAAIIRKTDGTFEFLRSEMKAPPLHLIRRNIYSDLIKFIEGIKLNQYGEISQPGFIGKYSWDEYLRESGFLMVFGAWLENHSVNTNQKLPKLDYDFLHKICIEYMNEQLPAIITILDQLSKSSKSVERAVTSFLNNPKNQTEIDKILMGRDYPKKLGKVIISYFENPYPMLHYLVKRFRFIYYEENETQPDKFAINDLLIQLGGWSDVKFLSEQGFVDDAERLKFRLLSTASHRLSSLNHEPSLELIEEELSASNHISNNIANETEKQTILQIISELQELKESVKKKTGSTIIIKDSVVMGDVSG